MQTPRITQRAQLFMIGWWEAFDTHEACLAYLDQYPFDPYSTFPSWKKWIISGLSEKYESFYPDMPNKRNAHYEEWKIWFEKYFPFLKNTEITLVWHSLGGIFLAKYLSENTFPRPIQALHLIAPVFDDDGLIGETVASFTLDTTKLPQLADQVQHIHIWSSIDDPIVPYSHAVKYQKFLPNAILHTFEHRGHFHGQSHFVELFLELL
jgi:uncharacterized protein